MITEKLKATAIASLKLGDSIEDVSSRLDLPYMLVKTWYEELDLNDLTMLQANTNALTRIVSGEVSPSNVDQLKDSIEEVSVEIVKQISNMLPFPDIVQAKALNLLADTCAKLYLTVVNKAGTNATPGSKTLSMFEQLSKD